MLAKRYNVVQMRQFFSSKSCVRLLSLPMRGEWIEIAMGTAGQHQPLSLPMRGEWIEIIHMPKQAARILSLPMRGEWIEMWARSSRGATDWSLPMRGEWIEIDGLDSWRFHGP